MTEDSGREAPRRQRSQAASNVARSSSENKYEGPRVYPHSTGSKSSMRTIVETPASIEPSSRPPTSAPRFGTAPKPRIISAKRVSITSRAMCTSNALPAAFQHGTPVPLVFVSPFRGTVSSYYVAGTLYLVATPIGNLEDITLRAIRVLREATWIACEDTRQTRKLLDHFSIATKLVSYHEHNEAARATELVQHLEAGSSGALVSDAGTPLISDPGYRLVAAAIASGIAVPFLFRERRPCSLRWPDLGLARTHSPSADFCLRAPRRARKTLESLKDEDCTLVFYEAPHRILEALEDIEAVLGPRPVVVARELTKMHEEFLRGTASEIRLELAARPSVRGGDYSADRAGDGRIQAAGGKSFGGRSRSAPVGTAGPVAHGCREARRQSAGHSQAGPVS